MTIERNERVLYLDNRHIEEGTQKVINHLVDALLEKKKQQKAKEQGTEVLQERLVRSMQNSLFLKFCGIDYEQTLQGIYIDKRFDRASVGGV